MEGTVGGAPFRGRVPGFYRLCCLELVKITNDKLSSVKNIPDKVHGVDVRVNVNSNKVSYFIRCCYYKIKK